MAQTTKSATKNNQNIPVPFDEFRGFIANVLKMNQWLDIMTPADLQTVTASQKEESIGHSKWQFQFKLTIKYRKHGDGTQLDYSISESKQKTLIKSQEKLSELVKITAEFAEEFNSTKSGKVAPTTYGAAKFADDAELREKGYVLKNVPSNRLLLAPWGEGEYLVVPLQYTNMHGMVVGPTGSGKSSGFFIPNLVYRTDASVIVTEATAGDEIPDLYFKTAGWRSFKGSKIYFFNPDYARGTRINPLDKLKYAAEGEFAQVADELANLVIVNTTPPGTTRSDPIWDRSEKHLLWIMIMHVARANDPSICNFGAIREIVRKSDKQIKALLASSASQIAIEEFDSFVSHSSENFRHGVFSGLLQRLNPWLSSVVQTMTSSTDLDLRQLEQENFSFYLSVPSRKSHLKPIAALIFNFLLDLSLNKRFKYPPALMLDEFTNFGAIPNINDALSIIRKRDLPVILGYQTQMQLSTTYTPQIASQITSQLATRIYFRPRWDKDAQDLSYALDDQTIVDKKTDDYGRTSLREIGKPLMSVRDISNLPPTDVIIQTESTNPIKTKRFDHFSCPAPTGFDMPEIPEHKLVSVEQLNNDQLQEQAKHAKDEAKKDPEFPKTKKKVEEVIQEAAKRHSLKPPPKPKPPAPEDDSPVPEVERPAPPRSKPKPKPKVVVQENPEDDWDIPG